MRSLLQPQDTPLPTSPTRGEVPIELVAPSEPKSPAHTSPLVGEAGRGVLLALKHGETR